MPAKVAQTTVMSAWVKTTIQAIPKGMIDKLKELVMCSGLAAELNSAYKYVGSLGPMKPAGVTVPDGRLRSTRLDPREC